MSSKVFYTPTSQSDSIDKMQSKFLSLLENCGLRSVVNAGEHAVVKIHFGEEGNNGFIRPEYTGVVCKRICKSGGSAILSDSNTLYRGRRVVSDEHRALAHEHGFTKDITGAEVVIASESADMVVSIPLGLQFINEAKIPRCYIDTDLFISMAHFKGHMLSGFGGTLKNIGMGCATREGKLAQHSDIAPVIYKDRCTGCGQCVKACQVNAISVVNNVSRINASRCTGCAACIAACAFSAIEVDWFGGGRLMQEKMVEYVAAVLRNVPRALHINFATKITAECDCLAQDDPRIVDDIGIFISDDPVAIDQACYDMVIERAGHDIFKTCHPSCDGKRQLVYAEKLGLGSRKYEIVNV